jgi:hypothetical protein
MTMSTTSTYTFIQGFFNGLFVDVNTPVATDQPFSESFNGVLFTVHRPNAEILVDLGPQINTQSTRNLVANKLKAVGGTLTSQIEVQGVVWPAVPYFFENPLGHKFTDMLVDVHFNFHIHTPWYCSDVDGTLNIYLFLFLNSAGHLQAALDGWWYSFDGGGPFCAGAVSDGIKNAWPSIKSSVQELLPSLTKEAAAFKFSRLYFLPGNGSKTSGAQIGNASTDLALGLLL